MPIREKIARMVVLRPVEYPDTLEQILRDGRGGVLDAGIVRFLTGGAGGRSGELSQVVEMIHQLREMSKLPLQLYLDAEWGLAQKFWFATRMPPQMALGAARSTELAYLNGQVIAREAAALGVSIVSNPVLDVNSNPKNPIINTRAFSDDVELVIELGRAYIRGMQEAGISACAKHFPGHGDTDTDSHRQLPRVDAGRETMIGRELRPYRELAGELWGVETGHLLCPALDAREPSTFSREMLSGILRGELGFQGLIVSDSMTMKAVKDGYGVGRAAVRAVAAGHDMILHDYESDPTETLDALTGAVMDGRLSMERVDDSVARVLTMQEKLGVLERRPVDLEAARRVIGCAQHREAARRIAQGGVTLIEAHELPLSPDRLGKTLVIATAGDGELGDIADFGAAEESSCACVEAEFRARTRCDVVRIPERPDRTEMDGILKRCMEYDTVVFASFVRVVAYKVQSGKADARQVQLMRAIRERARRFVVMIFGSPYVLDALPGIENCVLAYGDDQYCIQAAVQAAFGEIPARGRLPVTVNARYGFGYGIVGK